MADGLGCPLDEGSVHPCVIVGHDIGEALSTAFVLGWLSFVTWPGMLASLVAWIWLAIRTVGRRRQRRGAVR